MAPVRETHPHPIWDLGEYIGRFLEKAGVDSMLSKFFDLMPDVDLDEIRRVGNDIWGTDLENIGAVTGALNHAATQIPLIRDEVADGWRGEAFDKFKGQLDLDQALFEGPVERRRPPSRARDRPQHTACRPTGPGKASTPNRRRELRRRADNAPQVTARVVSRRLAAVGMPELVDASNTEPTPVRHDSTVSVSAAQRTGDDGDAEQKAGSGEERQDRRCNSRQAT
jgi:hypothetical protein